jgi:hypothetical protein
MTQIVFESGLVINLGGYIVERAYEHDYVDIVVGSPLKEDIKLDFPILNEDMVQAIKDKGLIVEYLREGDSLADKLEKVKDQVKAELGGQLNPKE